MNNAVESFVNLCRLCMGSNVAELPIFQRTESTECRNISDKITECLPVTISEDDELPKKICSDCYRSVDFIFNFRQLSYNSEIRLRVVLQNLKETAGTEIAEPDIVYDTVSVQDIVTDAVDALGDATSDGDIEISEVYFGDCLGSCDMIDDDIDTVIVKEESPSITYADEIPSSSSVVKQNSIEDTHISQIVESSNVSLRPFEEEQEERDDDATLRLWNVTLGSDFFLFPYDHVEQPPLPSKEPLSIDENEDASPLMSTTDSAVAAVKPQRSAEYTCGLCGSTFDRMLVYLQHYENAHLQFKCPFCAKSFKRRHVLESHLVVHSSRRDFACSFCKREFKRQTDLRRHIGRMHALPRTEEESDAVDLFGCEHCAYRTKHKRLIRTHVLSHLGVSLYACTLCGKSCADSGNLQAHHNSHVGIKPYQCEVCGNRFTRKHHMQAHRKMQHEELYSYQCDVCGRAFSYKTSLISHLKLHTGENRVHCDICHKTLSGKVALANHKKIHADEKEFVCGICGKMYVNKYSLQEHVLVHTASKPFQCLQCDKSFSMRKKLLNHERIHDQIRPLFRCRQCGKSYLSKFKLKEHALKSHIIPATTITTTADAVFAITPATTTTITISSNSTTTTTTTSVV